MVKYGHHSVYFQQKGAIIIKYFTDFCLEIC